MRDGGGEESGLFIKSKGKLKLRIWFFLPGDRVHNTNIDRPVCGSVLSGVHGVFSKGKTQDGA